jgi:glycosyltransferase involved in cell wall biosynthesis
VPPSVLCIVPARNEADRIAATVAALLQIDSVDRVVVVDDGSADGTSAAAAAAGATVIALPHRLGKGGAVEVALDRCDTPVVYLLVDADVGNTAAGAASLLAAIERDEADLAVGRLPRQRAAGFGAVKAIARGLIHRTCGYAPAEPLSGQRAVRGALLQACRPLAPRFGLEVAMTMDAVRMGARVAELDVDMHHRATGRGLRGFVHRGTQGVDIIRAAVPRILRLR